MDDRAERRRRLGAWYTPLDLVAHVVANTLPPSLSGDVTVLDPACGDGRFLVEAARVVRERGGVPRLIGIDIDPAAIDEARRRPELHDARLLCADALAFSADSPAAWSSGSVDVVVGNPPFLSPLSTAVLVADRERGPRSAGGAYADIAVRFLDLARDAVRRDGGCVGLVLPVSILASRDATTVRSAVMDECEMQWFWWSPTAMFDAAVTTCAIGFRRTPTPRRDRRVARSIGPSAEPAAPASQPRPQDHTWGALLAGDLGVPSLADLGSAGRLGDHAVVTADFRDQYYGILDALVDVGESCRLDESTVPLVTTAHVDPGRCLWGRRPVRYGKRRWEAPAVRLDQVDERIRRWATIRMVPKVLVATQTSVIEAVADIDGRWLPAVPLVSVVPAPGSTTSVEELAAVLTSPVPSALIARHAAGTGLSPRVVRVSARHLAQLPWPAGRLDEAVDALRAGRLEECGRAVSIAYGLSEAAVAEAHEWWWARSPR